MEQITIIWIGSCMLSFTLGWIGEKYLGGNHHQDR